MNLAEFSKHPGLFFVAATLLPLASFGLLLLASAVLAFVRRYRERDNQVVTPAVWPAYVATGAIAGAFVLSLIGSAIYLVDHAAVASADEGEGTHHAAAVEPDRWQGSWDWVGVTGTSASEPGRFLRLGYHVDSLTVAMFLMVTLVATLIHLFSMGYMAEERDPIVEDHQVHTEEGPLRRRGRFGRFFLFMSLFCFSMLNLVVADNLVQVFISWELVGICSYLLIGFYYERRSAANAAIKAFVTNRIGDAGFILGLLILWTYLGNLGFEDIRQRIRLDESQAPAELAGLVVRANPTATEEGGATLQVTKSGSQVVLFPAGKAFKTLTEGSLVSVKTDPQRGDFGAMPYWLLVVAGLGIFLGCVGKSAQFPLHVWLPDAMEGPTPVSALIHAATMVAAGVYLVGRVYPLFTPEARLVIAYTGGITLFLAATIALVMTDIKKVLAYSTVSQLGYMMLALGVGGWVAGLFHLLTHAFFKALLFLGSGSVIHGCHHEQDMTRMGGLYPKMRITALTMLVGVLTIAGIPLFSGWYSKDAILAQALGFVLVHPHHGLLLLLPLLTVGLTTFYMFRMWFLTFTGEPRDEQVHQHAHESPWLMTVPLIVLAFFSVVLAWGWPIWDTKASFLEHHLHGGQPAMVQAEFGRIEGEMLLGKLGAERQMAEEYHHLIGGVATALVLLAMIFAAVIYYKPMQALDPAEAWEQFPGVHAFLVHKWYFDELYSAVVVRPALVVAQWARSFDGRVIDGAVNGLGRFMVRLSRWDGLFDARIIDGIVNGLATICYAVGSRLRRVQTGYLRSYVLFLVMAAVGIFVILAYFVTRAAAG